MKGRHWRTRLSGSDFTEPEVNPSDSLLNLADIMLVLAVGIMLSLVLNWRVNISAAYNEQKADTAVEFSEDELRTSEEAPNSESMEKLGSVYYDERTGNYYIIGGEG
jgi:hypothetical protein